MRSLSRFAPFLASALASLHPVPTIAPGYLVGEQSSAAGDQWTIVSPIAWGADFASQTTLTIDRASPLQTVIGWGAAMTDTSGYNVVSLMNATTRAAFFEAGWGATGAGWTVGRVTVRRGAPSPRGGSLSACGAW